MKTIGILLAAGASVRFGAANKLLADWHGEALVRVAARRLAAAGCEGLAAVVSAQDVAAALPEGVTPLMIAPGQTMARSFATACAFAEAQGAGRLLLYPADMPKVPLAALRWLREGDESRACQCGGQPMAPAALQPLDWRFALTAGGGDQGGRAVLRGLRPAQLYPLTADEAQDIDLPEDLTR